MSEARVMEIAKAFMTPGNRESSPGELAAAYIDLHGRMERIQKEADGPKYRVDLSRIFALTKGTA